MLVQLLTDAQLARVETACTEGMTVNLPSKTVELMLAEIRVAREREDQRPAVGKALRLIRDASALLTDAA